MTGEHFRGHHQVVAAALEDWWLTTDPRADFTPDQVADHVELYLISSGYAIVPDTGEAPVPTRATITVTALLILLLAACGTSAAVHGRWGWALAALVLVVALGYEMHRDLADRRRTRRRRR